MRNSRYIPKVKQKEHIIKHGSSPLVSLTSSSINRRIHRFNNVTITQSNNVTITQSNNVTITQRNNVTITEQ